VTLQIVASLTIVIYNRNSLIIQAIAVAYPVEHSLSDQQVNGSNPDAILSRGKIEEKYKQRSNKFGAISEPVVINLLHL
jgi:hypothetical protein